MADGSILGIQMFDYGGLSGLSKGGEVVFVGDGAFQPYGGDDGDCIIVFRPDDQLDEAIGRGEILGGVVGFECGEGGG